VSSYQGSTLTDLRIDGYNQRFPVAATTSSRPSHMDELPRLIGTSEAIRGIEEEIECASRSNAKVLITGESGVGKEVVARLIHQRSGRGRAPLVTINCAGVPDTLLESELFGHVRGSFTDAHRDKKGWLEQAHAGTIFMDEIGEMSLRMQALLLRFLENGEIQRVGSDRTQSVVDVRVIAATNRNLLDRVAEKTFREDLYYRLNVIHVPIPPLRERREDIGGLFSHFVRSFCRQHRVPEPAISGEVLAHLIKYDWPGNVRELKNAVERIVVRSRGTITAADLPKEILGSRIASAAVGAGAPSVALADALYDRITVNGESFWSVVYEPFMSRDLTRADLRGVISRGLEQTRGSYKLLVQLFNLQPEDYKRLLSFLRKYECQLPFQKFRSVPARPDPPPDKP
jgi:transcriptional regulator with PAS, ATPase and Fis domain